MPRRFAISPCRRFLRFSADITLFAIAAIFIDAACLFFAEFFRHSAAALHAFCRRCRHYAAKMRAVCAARRERSSAFPAMRRDAADAFASAMISLIFDIIRFSIDAGAADAPNASCYFRLFSAAAIIFAAMTAPPPFSPERRRFHAAIIAAATPSDSHFASAYASSH